MPMQGQPQQAAVAGSGGEVKKKKARRAPRKRPRQWKPFSQLTWQERKALEEQEMRKNQQQQQQQQPSGDIEEQPQQQQQQQGPLPPPPQSQQQQAPISQPLPPQQQQQQQPQSQQQQQGSGVNSNNKRRKGPRGREQPPPAPHVTTQLIMAERIKQHPNNSPSPPGSPVSPSDTGDKDGSLDGVEDFEQAYDEYKYKDLEEADRRTLIERVRAQDKEIEHLKASVFQLQQQLAQRHS
jgi:hypothetical protein